MNRLTAALQHPYVKDPCISALPHDIKLVYFTWNGYLGQFIIVLSDTVSCKVRGEPVCRYRSWRYLQPSSQGSGPPICHEISIPDVLKIQAILFIAWSKYMQSREGSMKNSILLLFPKLLDWYITYKNEGNRTVHFCIDTRVQPQSTAQWRVIGINRLLNLCQSAPT